MQSTALTGKVKWIDLAARLGTALILGQSLFFKFTGAPEARYIFETLGVEPWGRLLTGGIELLTVVLLLVPRTAAFGALLAAGTLVGAIASHLGPLGIEVQGDGGTLFGLAIVALVLAAAVLWIRRCELPVVGELLCREGQRT